MKNHNSWLENYLEISNMTDDVYARYKYQKDKFNQEIADRYERKKLKNEIINEVMSKIDVILETEAIQKLEKMIKNLGN